MSLVMSLPWCPAALVVREDCELINFSRFDVVFRRVNTYYECLRNSVNGTQYGSRGVWTKRSSSIVIHSIQQLDQDDGGTRSDRVIG